MERTWRELRGTSGSEVSGSVASYGFVKNAIENTLKEVPAEKTIIGVPFYTRRWRETVDEDGNLKITSEAYGMQQAINVLTDHGVEPVWDDVTKQYYGEYESGGSVYKIWLEEDFFCFVVLQIFTHEDIHAISNPIYGIKDKRYCFL